MRTFITVSTFLTTLALTHLVHAAEPSTSEKKETKEEEKKPESSTLDIGVLGGVGFPRPIAIEPVLRLNETLLIGAEYSFLPKISISSVDTRMWAAAADLRWFPWKGGFFLGLRGGYQEIAAEATLTATNVGSYTERVEVGAWFVNPRLGFLWVWKPFALGIDAGLQIPISTTVSRSSLLAVAAPELDARITTATDTLGRTVIPTIDLLRIGLVF